MNLMENAKSFLLESLLKAHDADDKPEEWKFAILHLVQTIELLFKQRLSQEHPSLVYSNVDKQGLTVTLSHAERRLESIAKVSFKKGDKTAVRRALRLRNRIVHYEFELNAEASKANFSRLLGFLAEFANRELDLELSELIEDPVVLMKTVGIVNYAKQLLGRLDARFEAEEIDKTNVWNCPSCALDAFVVQDDINTCFVCGDCYDTAECNDCGDIYFIDELKEDGELLGKHNWVTFYLCEGCIDERCWEEERDILEWEEGKW